MELEETMKDLVGQRSRSVLRRMQKVMLSHSLNIARAFKVLYTKFYLRSIQYYCTKNDNSNKKDNNKKIEIVLTVVIPTCSISMTISSNKLR